MVIKFFFYALAIALFGEFTLIALAPTIGFMVVFIYYPICFPHLLVQKWSNFLTYDYYEGNPVWELFFKRLTINTLSWLLIILIISKIRESKKENLTLDESKK